MFKLGDYFIQKSSVQFGKKGTVVMKFHIRESNMPVYEVLFKDGTIAGLQDECMMMKISKDDYDNKNF